MVVPWRLIPCLHASGRTQMAIDQALLEQHRLGLSPPILRFYTWSPPAISLGYHQKHIPEHWYSLQWQGQPIEVVRRPSGGRAVLHQGDLTYALIVSDLRGTRAQVYAHLCEFLIQGMAQLGLDLTFGHGHRSYHHNANCFATATTADLVTSSGYKLIGSAQLYRDGCILQHGSIRLNPDPTLFETVFGQSLAEGDPTFATFGQSQAALIATVIHALSQAAQAVFAMQLVTDEAWEVPSV
jgi:lipoate---protein ligase